MPEWGPLGSVRGALSNERPYRDLTRVGIIIRDCTWHQHADGKEWVGFPAKPYETKTGETAWQPLVEFAEGAKEAREQFRKQALEAIHAFAAEQERESVS